MNRRNKKLNNKTAVKNKKIIRCKSKMVPVFEVDNCEDFVKKESADSNNICKNCKYSF